MIEMPLFVARFTRLVRLPLLVAAFFLVAYQTAHAQGFAVYEQGTCAMGRGGAIVASTCDDGSAVLYNPAGLAGTTGFTVSAGVTVIDANGSFTEDDTNDSFDLENKPTPVPHAYITYGINDRLAAGLGLYVPYGLGTKWPMDFGGRFLGFDNSLQSIYVQPTVAYRLADRISIGAGLTVAFGSITINQRQDLSSVVIPPGLRLSQLGAPAGTDFAEAALDAGGATGIGGNFGIQIQATERLSLGARYMTPIKLKYEGDATFTTVPFTTDSWTLPANNPLGAPAGTPVGAIQLPAGNPFGVPAGTPLSTVIQGISQQVFSQALVDQDVSTELEMPAQLVLGIGVQATDDLLLLADYQWTNWASFEKIEIDFSAAGTPDRELKENFKNTNAFRVGAEYDLNEAWTLRAGVLTHNAAAPDETVTPLLPEADRTEYVLGLGWKPTPSIELNAAYQYLAQKDRRGRIVEPPEGQEPTESLNSGVYSFYAHLFATTLTLHF